MSHYVESFYRVTADFKYTRITNHEEFCDFRANTKRLYERLCTAEEKKDI